MAKKPTPKRKHPESRGKARYSSFQAQVRKRLSQMTHLVLCKNCGQAHLLHQICMNCGFYNGRKVLDVSKKVKDKITTLSA